MATKALLFSLVVLGTIFASEACSCSYSHPQQQFCGADFVILARVVREFTTPDKRIYKVRIRKEFKMSEKAQVALKSGKLTTNLDEAMCGATLTPGKTYVLAGRIISLRAHISLCNLQEVWRDLTPRQKKGFNKMYHHGCLCDVHVCPSKKCPQMPNACLWTTVHSNPKLDCERSYGICLRNHKQRCVWVKNKLQHSCMNELYKKKHYLPSRDGPGRMFGQ